MSPLPRPASLCGGSLAPPRITPQVQSPSQRLWGKWGQLGGYSVCSTQLSHLESWPWVGCAGGSEARWDWGCLRASPCGGGVGAAVSEDPPSWREGTGGVAGAAGPCQPRAPPGRRHVVALQAWGPQPSPLAPLGNREPLTHFCKASRAPHAHTDPPTPSWRSPLLGL